MLLPSHKTVTTSRFRAAAGTLGVAGMALLVTACADQPEAAPAADAPAARGSIVDIAVAAGQFSALVRAVDAAGLVETLDTGGPFTVFAPTDGAFANLPDGALEDLMEDPEALSQILLYHVVPGELTNRDLRELSELETAQGEHLRIEMTPQGITINGTYLLTSDIRASNGVIHVITSVLLPGSE